MRVCLDTQGLIWGIKRQGDRDRVRIAREFFDRADKSGNRVVIPAVAVAEMLVQANETQRAEWAAVLEACFEVAPFDLPAAVEAASLERRRRDQLGGVGGATGKLRFDVQIAATALAAGAECLVTYDGDLRAVCEGRIPTRGFEEPDTLEERW